MRRHLPGGRGRAEQCALCRGEDVRVHVCALTHTCIERGRPSPDTNKASVAAGGIAAPATGGRAVTEAREDAALLPVLRLEQPSVCGKPRSGRGQER